jgi:hypothetical protein
MGDSRLTEAAKKAMGSAAAKAGELSERASDKVGDVKDLAEDALARLKETLNDFSAALPLLREAGYVLEEVSIKLGLTPRIVADFSGDDSLSDERLEELLTEHAGRALATMMVWSFHPAGEAWPIPG